MIESEAPIPTYESMNAKQQRYLYKKRVLFFVNYFQHFSSDGKHVHVLSNLLQLFSVSILVFALKKITDGLSPALAVLGNLKRT